MSGNSNDFPTPPAAPPPSPAPARIAPFAYQPLPRSVVAARRAGWLMIGLGIVLVFGGGCFSLVGAALPTVMPQLSKDEADNLRQVETQTHMSAQKMMLIMAAVFVAIGLFQIVAGIFVTRGGRNAIRVAVIVTATLMTIWILNLFAGVIAGSAPNLAEVAGVLLIGACLFGWQLSWLFQAMHAARDGATATVGYPQQMIMQAGQPPSQQQAYPPQPPEPGPIGWAYPPPPPKAVGDA